jgi:translocator assembly and maintenance protein 41
MKQYLNKVVQTAFPSEHVKFVFGYGSGVFKQANYNIKQGDLVLDIVMAVDDTSAFHKKNMARSPTHYSGLAKTFGPKITNRVNKGFTQVYYNPHVNLASMANPGMPELAEDGRKLKYGVVSVDNMIKDLTTWEIFFLAGRMQKMILHIMEERHEGVYQAIDLNLQKAMQTAVFLNAHNDTFTKR